jgi:beta-lactamase regulating signal transducer with metallopeptidase domain
MERALAEYLVNALWQVPLLAGGAWLLVRVVRPGPQIQHATWLAVLGLAVLLPIHGMGMGAFTPPSQLTTAVLEESTASRDIPSSRKDHFFPRMRRLHLNATAARWVVRMYLATVALALIRIARGWRAARRLVASSRETSGHRVALAHYSQRFQVVQPELRESADVSSPVIVGARAPVLLLPEGFARFTEDEVVAALCHELAHIKRQDYLMNMVCQVVALPLAWHPAVDQVQQRIRMTREMVCDAMAAQEMKSHIGYAKCLLVLAQSMLRERGMARQAQWIGLFSNNSLEERVMELMETTTMSARAKLARLATGATVMIAAGSLAAMFHVTPTMAESRPEAPPPQATATTAGQTQPAATTPESSTTRAAVEPAHKGRPAHAKHLEKKGEQQSEEAEREMSKAAEVLNAPEFRRQMEDAQQHAAEATTMLNSPEFKQRMEDAQQQMAKATAMLNSPEFKQRMEDAQQQMAKATAMLNGPEFKQRMEDAQRQMEKATEMLNNPEFKQRMDDLQKQLQSGESKRKAEEDRHTETEPAPTK